MKRFLGFARISAAIAGGVIVVFLVKPIAALISGEFTGGVPAATAGRTVYEISANVVALLMLGFLFGVLHGWTFGLTSLRQTAIAATVPVFLLWVFLTIATWFVAAPAVIAVVLFGFAVLVGARFGAGFPGACSLS